MGSIVRAILASCLALVSFAMSVPARAAADPGVTTTVEPIPTGVTLRRGDLSTLPLSTLAAYRVTITNRTTNTLNRVFLSGTAVNVGGTDLVVYDSAESATCTTGPAANVVQCTPSASSLAAGGSTQFLVVFRAPTTGQRIDFNWTAGGFEGNGGGNGCCAQPGTAQTLLVDPVTDTSYRVSLRSFVKLGGGTFYTGDRAIVTDGTKGTPDDPFSTLVIVPAAANSSRGTIAEAPETCNGLPACYRSTIGIVRLADGTPTPFSLTNYLTVVLRLDVSRTRGTKIESVLLDYTDEFNVVYPIGLCGSPTTPRTDGVPCIAARKVYKGSDGAAFNGDFEWTLISIRNGSIKIFP